MRTKEEIKADIENLRKEESRVIAQISDLHDELIDLLSDFKVGQRVTSSNSEYEISGRRLSWGEVRYTGRKVLKSGALQKCTAELWGKIEAKP